MHRSATSRGVRRGSICSKIRDCPDCACDGSQCTPAIADSPWSRAVESRQRKYLSANLERADPRVGEADPQCDVADVAQGGKVHMEAHMESHRSERLPSWSRALVVGFLSMWVVACAGTGGGPPGRPGGNAACEAGSAVARAAAAAPEAISPPGTCEQSCAQRFLSCTQCDRSLPGGCLTLQQCTDGRNGCLAACNCRPMTCADLGQQCGAATDGCGTQLDCGGCSGGLMCVAGRCLTTTQCRQRCDDLLEACAECDRSSRPDCLSGRACLSLNRACVRACGG